MGPIAPSASARAELTLWPALLPAQGAGDEVRHFLDLRVDGRSLRDLVPGAADMVTGLCAEWVAEEVSRTVDALAGAEGRAEPGLGPHEVPLLVCPACGDLDCGAVVARVEAGAGTVTWRGFRWAGVGDPSPDDVIAVLGPALTFERGAYQRTLRDAARRVSRLAG